MTTLRPMESQRQILVDSPDTGDIPPALLSQLVEELRSELPDHEIHSAWIGQSAAHTEDYWPELIIWVTDNRELIQTTILVTITAEATKRVLNNTSRLCIKLARSTGDGLGKVFKRRYIEPDREPVDEDLDEEDQEELEEPPIRD